MPHPARARLLRGAAGSILAVLVALASAPPGGGAPEAAGSTAAVLSFIDAASGRVEVVRHWPGAASDVTVYPFVPYFWDGCPGAGAIMMLVTGVPGEAPLAARVARALEARAPADHTGRREVARVVEALRTPGDPAVEALKAAAPWLSDLDTYERLGYAVFMFLHWQGLTCRVSLVAVPEGYGIPFVR